MLLREQVFRCFLESSLFGKSEKGVAARTHKCRKAALFLQQLRKVYDLKSALQGVVRRLRASRRRHMAGLDYLVSAAAFARFFLCRRRMPSATKMPMISTMS